MIAIDIFTLFLVWYAINNNNNNISAIIMDLNRKKEVTCLYILYCSFTFYWLPCGCCRAIILNNGWLYNALYCFITILKTRQHSLIKYLWTTLHICSTCGLWQTTIDMIYSWDSFLLLFIVETKFLNLTCA